jgi:DNA mismatch repair ATPase MutL
VLKAKNNNGDFVYAPKLDANIEDVFLKVIGKECALQCDWTALEADSFETHAFLPKPTTASGPKIANQGAFVSIDARPVSSSRGTSKQAITAFKDRLRKSNPSLAGVKDPFLCMNIICPPDSDDPTLNPAKDDVMFDNGDVVLGVVQKLFKSYYPEAVVEVEAVEQPMSVEQSYEPQSDETRAETPTTIMRMSP